jgi:sugar/nucleoside kinase (ribokinase family)
MLPEDFLNELESFLRSEPRKVSVVVMPDFFIDRILCLNWNAETLSEKLENVAQRKGGSIDGLKQAELRGGNAINTASALIGLGASVTPIVCTDKTGTQLIRLYLKSDNVDLSHVKTFDKPSLTTAMELKAVKGKVNIMLRDVGALASFGPDDLDSEDFKAIENADYTCVFNWAGTRRFGTQLAQTVFSHAKTKGKGKTYCDTADPTPNKAKIPELVKLVLKSRNMDILSVNENEAVCYASQLENRIEKLGKSLSLEELAIESAKILASHFPPRVDLHTTNFSATFSKKSETVVPAFNVPVLRATGAGDAWNAGNIIGDAYKLSDSCRLALANAVAAYYISSSRGTHPSRKQLREFCRKAKMKAM